MVYSERKIKQFSDLEAWRESHKLALFIYNVTKEFPKQELFGLTSQMRRAAVSVSSNIAEGFSRSTLKDKANFFTIAKGSLTELESQILLALDLKYLNEENGDKILTTLHQSGRLITGLIKYTQK